MTKKRVLDKTKVGITLPSALLEKADEKRVDLPAFIKRAIEYYLVRDINK
ncbi:MAG: hypothetical protein WAM14_17100 [Candidatus Nitrosopolaris sp.]